jgi:N-acetylglucosaminyl-diphospho-decaprenol L-rhamnosyltransferase
LANASRTEPRVDVVIVNWNAGPALRDCLRSLAESRRSSYVLGRVVIVDNASTDGSLAGIEEGGLPLEVLRNPDNRGFAAACNQGARVGAGELLLFLNPDTRLFPETLELTVGFMSDDRNTAFGICGAQMVGADGSEELSCGRFPTFGIVAGKMLGLTSVFPGRIPQQRLTSEETARSGTVDQVIGAYFLIRRPLFEALGGFDERFFVYFEEVDLAYRAAQRGYRSYFLKEARVEHLEHVSSDQVPGQRLFYSLRGRTEYARKHWPRWQAALLSAMTVAVELPARGVSAALRLRAGGVTDVGQAAALYARYLVRPR